MDTTTATITVVSMICIGIFSLAAVAGALYGILVWLPASRKKKTDALKASGRQGKATILRIPEHINKYDASRRSLYTMVTIGLEIDVPGIDVYQVDKLFTFPTGWLTSLEVGKVVDVWVDPQNPRDLDKIVIHIK
jgi:hypothetical protein